MSVVCDGECLGVTVRSAFLASFAFTATPGKAGEAVKSVLLRGRYGVPLADGMGVLLVERLGDLLAVLVLAAGGLTLLADAQGYFLIAASGVIAATLFVSKRGIYEPILSRMARPSQALWRRGEGASVVGRRGIAASAGRRF